MDLVSKSAFVKDGIKFSQKSEKCPPNTTLGWANQIQFLCSAILCSGGYQVLVYDVDGIANFGFLYIVMSGLMMFVVSWPIVFIEMAIGQKHEANMINSLGQVYKSLWTFGAIGAVLTYLNFVTTTLELSSFYVFSLTAYYDWRGDPSLVNLTIALDETGILEYPDDDMKARNPPILVCCSVDGELTREQYERRYVCLINEIARVGLEAPKGCDLTISHYQKFTPIGRNEFLNKILTIETFEVATAYLVAYLIVLLITATVVGFRYNVSTMLFHQSIITFLLGMGFLLASLIQSISSLDELFIRILPPEFYNGYETRGLGATTDWIVNFIYLPIIGAVATSSCFCGNNYYLASHLPVRARTCVYSFIIVLGQTIVRSMLLVFLYSIHYNKYSVMVDSAEYGNERIRTLDMVTVKNLFIRCMVPHDIAYHGVDYVDNPSWSTSVSIASGAILFLALPSQILRIIVATDAVTNTFENRRSFRKFLILFYFITFPFCLLASSIFWITVHVLSLICMNLMLSFAAIYGLVFVALGVYSKLIFYICVIKGARLNCVEIFLIFMAKWVVSVLLLPIGAIVLIIVSINVTDFTMLLYDSTNLNHFLTIFQICASILPLLFILVSHGMGKERNYGKEPYETEYYAAPLKSLKHQKGVRILFGAPEFILIQDDQEVEVNRRGLFATAVGIGLQPFHEGDEDDYKDVDSVTDKDGKKDDQKKEEGKEEEKDDYDDGEAEKEEKSAGGSRKSEGKLDVDKEGPPPSYAQLDEPQQSITSN